MLARRGKGGFWLAAICAAVLAVPGIVLAAGHTTTTPQPLPVCQINPGSCPPDDVFNPSTITIDQGDTLTYQNDMNENHNLKGRHAGRFNGRNFSTAGDVNAGSANVDGIPYLTAGTYKFICTLHVSEGMIGTLNVTSNGTPMPLPGLDLRILSGDLAAVQSDGLLPVRVRSASFGRAVVTAKLGSTTLGSKVLHFYGPNTRRPDITLTPTGQEALAGRSSARITVRGKVSDSLGTKGYGRVTRKLQ